MAWKFVSKELATHFCNVSSDFMRDEYSDIVEEIILEEFRGTFVDPASLGVGETDVLYTETLDGMGTNILELSNTPINSVVSISVISPLQSDAPLLNITDNLLIREKHIIRKVGVFPEGIGNIQVSYRAGSTAVDSRLKFAELAALSYICKYLIANRGDDTIKFSRTAGIGSNQYSPRPGLPTKLKEIIREYVPSKVRIA